MWNPQGEAQRYATNCGDSMGYYQRYPVPVAAALWCGVPADEVQQVLQHAQDVGRAVVSVAYIRCLEPKCRALHEAIESGELRVYREDGPAILEHVKPERRHVARTELREWIAKHYPDQKPPTLFDATERQIHSGITPEVLQSLTAERNALEAKLNIVKTQYLEALEKLNSTQGERDSLKQMVEKMSSPGQRAETTYLNIIGGLLGLMLGKNSADKPNSVYIDQSSIISGLLGHYIGTPGIAPSTLEQKFAEAKRSIKSN